MIFYAKKTALYNFYFCLIIGNYEMKVKIMRYKFKNYCIKYPKTQSTLLEKVEIIK